MRYSIKHVVWFIVVCGCVFAAACFVGAIAGKTDAEKTAASTMALVLVLVPYVFARAISELVADDHRQHREDADAAILRELRELREMNSALKD